MTNVGYCFSQAVSRIGTEDAGQWKPIRSSNIGRSVTESSHSGSDSAVAWVYGNDLIDGLIFVSVSDSQNLDAAD